MLLPVLVTVLVHAGSLQVGPCFAPLSRAEEKGRAYGWLQGTESVIGEAGSVECLDVRMQLEQADEKRSVLTQSLRDCESSLSTSTSSSTSSRGSAPTDGHARHTLQAAAAMPISTAEQVCWEAGSAFNASLPQCNCLGEPMKGTPTRIVRGVVRNVKLWTWQATPNKCKPWWCSSETGPDPSAAKLHPATALANYPSRANQPLHG